MGSVMLEASQATGISTLEGESAIGSLHPKLLGNPRIAEFYDKPRKTVHALDAVLLPLYNRTLLSDADSPLYV